MLSTVINTPEDLAAAKGTPAYDSFMSILRGTLWRIEKDDSASTWTAVADDSAIARFGLSRADFGDVAAPALPVYVPDFSAEPARIAALWQGAHDYEYAQISGSAIGLLAIGVMQAKPKCLAVQAWIKGIWALYYQRKASASTDNDYTAAGVCPYSVPDLMAELGV